MQYLGQIDGRWINRLLGGGPLTIGQAGCYLTGFTNVANIGGAGIDVPTLDQVFLNDGRFARDGNGNVTDLLSDASLNGLYGCQYQETKWYTGIAADLNYPQDPLSEQYLMEIWINGNPARTHFVLYFSGHSADDFKIVDSWDGQVKLLKGAYGDPATIIQKFIHYHLPALVPAPAAPAPEPAPAPVVPEAVPAPVEPAPPAAPVEVTTPEAPAEPVIPPAPEPAAPTGQAPDAPVPVRHDLPATELKINGKVQLADGSLGAEVFDFAKGQPIEMMRNGEVIQFVSYTTVGDQSYFQNETLLAEMATYGINGADLAYPEQGVAPSAGIAKMEATVSSGVSNTLKKATSILDTLAGKKKGN